MLRIKKDIQFSLFNKKHNAELNKALELQKQKYKQNKIDTRNVAKARLKKIIEIHNKKQDAFINHISIFDQKQIIKNNIFKYKKNITEIKNITSEVYRLLDNFGEAHKDLVSEKDALENYIKSENTDYQKIRDYNEDVAVSQRKVSLALDGYKKQLTLLVFELRNDGYVFNYNLKK